MPAQRVRTVIENGRLLDPETGRDETGWVALDGGQITALGSADEPPPEAVDVIDAAGLVVAPGFIDMHSHAQTINGARLQALDGVTTALELEGGALPVAAHYAWAADHGRPINYGFAAGWAPARMVVLDDAPVITPQQDPRFPLALSMFEQNQSLTRWRGAATDADEDRIVDTVAAELEAGSIGVGLLQGYVPGSRRRELDRLAELAAKTRQPLFVHARSMAPSGPGNALDAVVELIEASEQFGAPIHLCHLNSTSGARGAEITAALTAAQQRGVPITTEAYPYPAGSTVIGAAFLDPDRLAGNGLSPSSLTYLPLQERIRDAARLRELRETDPGGLCIITNYDLDDPAQRARLLACVTFPDAAVASDAMPLTYVGPGPSAPGQDQVARAQAALTGDVWPLPPGLFTHPRSAGCFATALSWLVRDLGTLSLTEVVRRCTLRPAEILGEAVPALRRKGRLQVGMDADVTLFDADRVAPGGDFTALGASRGFAHVIVGGVSVVRDGELDPQAMPGQGLFGAV